MFQASHLSGSNHSNNVENTFWSFSVRRLYTIYGYLFRFSWISLHHIYTFIFFCCLILLVCKKNGQYVVQRLWWQSIDLVFSLTASRLANAAVGEDATL